jgi:hypothetical protein
MIKYDLIETEEFMGEPPPVLYIFGRTTDFHKLAVSLLPFLKESNYCITNHDIGILGNTHLTITMSNRSNNGVSISEDRNNIFIDLDLTNWIDVIIELVTLALKPSHSYFDYTWLENININVIFEAK